MSRRQILIINRSYWPDAEATGQLLTELCEDLSDRFDVTVLAGQPNRNPQGVPFRRWGNQYRRGVQILRVPHTQFHKASTLGRLCNWATFCVAAFFATLWMRRPSVVLVQSDPFLLPLLGRWLKLRYRSRLVVHLQDLYPHVAVALGMRRNRLVDLLAWALRKAYRAADRIMVPSADMQRLIVGEGTPADLVERVPNWSDVRMVHPLPRENSVRSAAECEGKFVVMYSGNLGLAQPWETILDAASLLKDEPSVRFLIAGEGAAQTLIERRIAAAQLTNIRLLPCQPKGRLAESLSAADLHLVPVDPRVISFLMPSKLYGVLAAGRPVLTIAPEGCELAEVVVGCRVGIRVDSDPQAMATSIRWAATNSDELRGMGQRARQLAEEEYDRRVVTARIQRLLSELVGDPLPVPEAPQDSRPQMVRLPLNRLAGRTELFEPAVIGVQEKSAGEN